VRWLEVTSADEYRARQRKIVTLPSGFVFEIRKMSPLTFAEMFELVGASPNDPQGVAEEKVRENVYEILKLVIPKCVVSPKISLEATDEDVLALEDLDMDDFFALLDEISTFSGLGAEDMEERQSFRDQSAG